MVARCLTGASPMLGRLAAGAPPSPIARRSPTPFSSSSSFIRRWGGVPAGMPGEPWVRPRFVRPLADENGAGSSSPTGRRRAGEERADSEERTLWRAATRWVRTRAKWLSPSSGETTQSDAYLAWIKVGEPVTEQDRLAESSWCGHETESVARLKGGIQLLDQSGPRNELRAPGRREELGSENRSRHAPWILGAQRTS